MITQTSRANGYTLQQGNQPVDPSLNAEARQIDTNKDHKLSRKELLAYSGYNSKGKPVDPDGGGNATDDLIQLRHHLTATPSPRAKYYKSYDQSNAELRQLAREHSDMAKLVNIGKSYEGRDILALEISKNVNSDEATAKLPGVMLTGLHHAREWMSIEPPLKVAHELLENYNSNKDDQRRVDQAVTWIVPVVNPDGLEHSRNVDPLWRKNRQPVEGDVNGKHIQSHGIDPNRNYDDKNPAHSELYRAATDKPGTIKDDFGGSDDPRAEDYRGPAGHVAPEVSAIFDYQLEHKNIRGVINNHSYGGDILIPTGNEKDPADYKFLEGIANKMSAASDNKLKVINGATGLYPTTGDSDDFERANGIVAFTFELGRSFQPAPSTIAPITDQAKRSQIIDLNAAGKLPERT